MAFGINSHRFSLFAHRMNAFKMVWCPYSRWHEAIRWRERSVIFFTLHLQFDVAFAMDLSQLAWDYVRTNNLDNSGVPLYSCTVAFSSCVKSAKHRYKSAFSSGNPVQTLRQQMRSAKGVLGTWQTQMLSSSDYFVDVPAMVIQYDIEPGFQMSRMVWATLSNFYKALFRPVNGQLLMALRRLATTTNSCAISHSHSILDTMLSSKRYEQTKASHIILSRIHPMCVSHDRPLSKSAVILSIYSKKCNDRAIGFALLTISYQKPNLT